MRLRLSGPQLRPAPDCQERRQEEDPPLCARTWVMLVGHRISHIPLGARGRHRTRAHHVSDALLLRRAQARGGRACPRGLRQGVGRRAQGGERAPSAGPHPHVALEDGQRAHLCGRVPAGPPGDRRAGGATRSSDRGRDTRRPARGHAAHHAGAGPPCRPQHDRPDLSGCGLSRRRAQQSAGRPALLGVQRDG